MEPPIIWYMKQKHAARLYHTAHQKLLLGVYENENNFLASASQHNK